ncbi:MAG: transposase domain-containing protein [Victivallaceae bacterium]
MLNFLFVGSKRGGETAAIFMCLIATCKANSVNPHEYLKDILARINSHPFLKLAELLPHNWKVAGQKK